MITTATFNRAYGWSGDPNCVLYRSDNVVIGPANQAYTWVAFAKEHSTAMVLRVSSQMPQRGSRKCGTLGGWFSEPPNKELGSSPSSEASRCGSRKSCYDKWVEL